MDKLWAGAGFYVFPSLFEGFGLSLVEAMARGIPCACSNNGALGEIAGDVAITFAPESVGEIAAALERLLTEPLSARTARISRGLEWSKRFSWADHAAGLAALIAETGEKGRETRRASRVSRSSAAFLFGIPVAKVTEPEAVERIVALAKEAGVTMTGAGATWPYKKDPDDSNIRIAPTLPPLSELDTALDVFCCCVKLAYVEKLLG